MCTNETVLGDSKKQLPKPNGTNRTVRSFVLCLFFLFINYWPVQTHKNRLIRKNQQCQTKSNTRREGERMKKKMDVSIESGNKRLNRFIWL